MTKDEALKLALEALKQIDEAMPFPVAKLAQKVIKEALAQPEHGWTPERIAGMARLKEAQDKKLAQPEQEPVAWLLTDKNINSLQVDSIQRLIDRLKHAHHTDLCVRINGQDEWFQADWLKHMVRASPPQRTWTGLTDEDFLEACQIAERGNYLVAFQRIQAKLKEKNT